MTFEPARRQICGNPPARAGQGHAGKCFTSKAQLNRQNPTSAREEVVINFGVNQNGDRTQQDYEIQLLHRLILSPFAAKRLQELLTRLIKEYEARARY